MYLLTALRVLATAQGERSQARTSRHTESKVQKNKVAMVQRKGEKFTERQFWRDAESSPREFSLVLLVGIRKLRTLKEKKNVKKD